jgi:DNA polymerase-3 subunit epsilon
MKLNLERDLIIFDIESTGQSRENDRIVQIATLRIFADGRPNEEKCRLINPTIPISPEAIAIHHITDEMVVNEPTFERIAKNLFTYIDNCDLCGFNSNRFDIPMLMNEFARCGIELDMGKRNIIDVQRIYHQFEQRNLRAALRFYCNKELEGAHDAMNDVRATYDVLLAQLNKYDGVDCELPNGDISPTPVKNNMKALNDFTRDADKADFTGQLRFNSDGEIVFNFGKYQGKTIATALLNNDEKYIDWILGGNFCADTKQIIRTAVAEFKRLRQFSAH